MNRSGQGVAGRVFVVGVPRSGTTLVQSLLAAHSAVASFTESHFFDRHFTLVPASSHAILTRSPEPRLREFLAENSEEPPEAAAWFAPRGGSIPRFKALLPLRTRAAALQLLRVLDQLTLRRRKAHWVEKTPRHLRYLPLLAGLPGVEPRPRFVHVIRRGLEVVASLHWASRHWERSYDLETCVRRWNADVGFSLGRVAAPTDRFVFYEELTERPEATLRRLLAGLGLAWEPEIVDRFRAAADELVTQQEAGWKANVGREIRPSATAMRRLTPVQRDRVSRSLRLDLYDRIRELTGRAAAENGDAVA